jgi:8-oxo-dGTP pyrophosphatase MutT (NUDIX family)
VARRSSSCRSNDSNDSDRRGNGIVAVSPYRPDLVECWIFRVASEGRLEILLMRRAPGRIFAGLWQCVTGRLEPDEAAPLAALREVTEETGFGPDRFEAVYDLDQTATFYDEDADALVSSVLFAVRVAGDAEPELSHEHDAARWAEPDDALRLAVWPSYRESIDRIRGHLLDPELAPWFQLGPDGRRLRR